MGPTVAQAALARMRECVRLIGELQVEKQECARRAREYANSSMLESERLATKAEAYQRYRLHEPEGVSDG